MSQEKDHIHRGQAGIQVLHVHQNGKGNAAGDVLAVLNQQDGPQQNACTAAVPISDHCIRHGLDSGVWIGVLLESNR